MAAIVDLIPSGVITPNVGYEYHQPVETIVDVSGYTEVAVFLTVTNMNLSGNTLTISLITAAENRHEQYFDHAPLTQYSGAAPTYPDKTFIYLQGPGTVTGAGGEYPGFGRYLGLLVAGTSSSTWDITLGVKLVLKP